MHWLLKLRQCFLSFFKTVFSHISCVWKPLWNLMEFNSSLISLLLMGACRVRTLECLKNWVHTIIPLEIINIQFIWTSLLPIHSQYYWALVARIAKKINNCVSNLLLLPDNGYPSWSTRKRPLLCFHDIENRRDNSFSRQLEGHSWIIYFSVWLFLSIYGNFSLLPVLAFKLIWQAQLLFIGWTAC